jgi:tricorn protease
MTDELRRVLVALVLLPLLIALHPAAAAAQTRLLRQPTVSERHIAFSYASNIWITDRAGGAARRLTSAQGEETLPKLSPDGRWVAFSAQYGGNTDVYMVPVEGGEPRRLTWHPGADLVQGWSPDGRRIVFASARAAAPSGGAIRFWSVSVDGGLPEALPMPRAFQGKYSPDGTRFAYRMATSWDDEWRNYRGGQNRPIWILDLATHELETTPEWDGSKDIDPVWIDETIYFLSDRDWAMNVWSYDTRTKALRQVTRFADFDVKSMDAGGGVIVFEQAGYIHELDPRTGSTRRVDISVRGDFPWLMPQWKPVAERITNAAISPTGRRAVFEARGDIFTVPAEKGDWRNLTSTAGVAERNPAWSPDGKWISWFSDHAGEYRLFIAPQDGAGERREIELPEPSFQFTPAWSPDSKKLLFTDTHLRLWVVDVATGKATHAGTDTYMAPERSMNPVWSPDSRWIAFARRLDNQFRAIFVHSLESGRTEQVTDGMSDATWPAWDAGGKYLYFLASTNYGPTTGWLDMSSYDRPVTRALYLAVLRKGEPSPLLPESDEEGAAPARGSAGASAAGGAGAGAAAAVTARGAAGAGTAQRAAAANVAIDFGGILQRTISLGVVPRNYSQLRAGAAGTIFFLETVPESGVESGPAVRGTLHRYMLKEREAKTFLANVQGFTVSADGSRLLYRSPGQGGGSWGIVETERAAPAAGAGRIDVSSLSMLVDPRAEWRQIFDEGWRFQRDFLYVDNLHGADYVGTKAQYAPLLEHVGHRSDLNYLLDMLGAEVAVGHSYVRGGDMPQLPNARAGLLGADLEVADGRYRIAKIYTGESWNPELSAPLSGPGIDVAEGEFLLAINGAELRAPDNPYRLLEGTAGRQTVITVGPRPSMNGARSITVVPVASEAALRQRDWIEANRRKVDELSGGRLAYVYVPNTGNPGYTYFNRYYFAQQHKHGVIIDERFNGGGSAADYMIDVMSRNLHGYFNNRVAERIPFTSPGAGIWGPKVMIINEMAGSGGDLLPYMFRKAGIGTLVGTRTWGGLVGTWDTPQLIDGGSMIAPRGGFFDTDGQWSVENEGVAPDIHVEMTPREVIGGGDPQLERAVAEALRLLQQNPVQLKPEPPAPVRYRRPAGGG